MRVALDAALEDRALDGPGPRPTLESIVEAIGPLANAAPRRDAAAASGGRPAGPDR